MVMTVLLTPIVDVWARTVSRDELGRVATQQVTEWLQQQPDRRFSLLEVQAAQETVVPDGSFSWQIDIPERNLHTGKQSVRLRAMAGGRSVADAQVWVTLKQRERYLVLSRPLRRGDVVRQDDLSGQDVEQQRPMAGYLLASQADRIVGQETVRAIAPDQPLQASWFALPQAINRGGKVRVLVRQGAMFIEAMGVAMANGRMGDVVEIQNSRSQKRFMAQVTGPGEVTVRF
ncbi:MAG: flagellar basal body P-ring formation protein FlgA [Magnetococcales bacterium]|nr:flagellar basal body P-ring formation protein FlgA [Magnetococcales bacterium]